MRSEPTVKVIPPGMVTSPVDGYAVAWLNILDFISLYFIVLVSTDYHSPPLVYSPTYTVSWPLLSLTAPVSISQQYIPDVPPLPV